MEGKAIASVGGNVGGHGSSVGVVSPSNVGGYGSVDGKASVSVGGNVGGHGSSVGVVSPNIVGGHGQASQYVLCLNCILGNIKDNFVSLHDLYSFQIPTNILP